MRYVANGLGPNVTPIAKSHVTPVCEDGRQTGAHKIILDCQLFLMLGELLKDGGGTATGLDPSVTSIAGPFCELGPSVNTH